MSILPFYYYYHYYYLDILARRDYEDTLFMVVSIIYLTSAVHFSCNVFRPHHSDK